MNHLNDSYNAQDTILLCQIIENRSQLMQEKFNFNPRKCNSASMLSVCVRKTKSKSIMFLPTCNEHGDIFEKNSFWRVSSVNTRYLLPNDKINYKRDDLKIMYSLKLDLDKKTLKIGVLFLKFSSLMKIISMVLLWPNCPLLVVFRKIWMYLL